ncbi:hypothetical protein SAMN05444280_12718 [Tangfeifania diversioriginum]|uniref:Uncharacterized protein n=1 Tax=Tangfeifania diversioriginum TaxID=1168035 RepID=A0A1M6LJX1_9BACT|nr:hypothetical protein SAMN05444280_12718 [Tangfeifania diversioriginum]
MTDLKVKIEGKAQTIARFTAQARQFKIEIDEPPAPWG